MNFCNLLKQRRPNKLNNDNTAELIKRTAPNMLKSFAFNSLFAFQSFVFFMAMLIRIEKLNKK